MQNTEETTETSEEVINTESESETSETDNQADEVSPIDVSGIFNQNGQKLETTDTALPAEQSEEAETESDGTEQDDDEQETDDGEESETPATTDDNDSVLELSVEGSKESFDIKKKEDKEKLIEYAQKGRFLERERAKDNAEKKQLNQLAQSVAYQILYNQSAGKTSHEDFIEKPYDMFIGQGNDEADDLKLWNEHKNTVQNNFAKLNEFSNRHKKTAEGFLAMATKFKENHPEVEDVDKWIEENIAPYHAPVYSYGAVEYPKDTFEMKYFYMHKDKIIKEAVDKAVKDHIKKPAVKQTVKSPAVKTETNKFTLNTQATFNPDNRQLVH